MIRKELEDLILKSVDGETSQDKLVSDLIFAGFTYSEIQGALNELLAEEKIPVDFMNRKGLRQAVFRPAQAGKLSDVGADALMEEENIKHTASRFKKIFIFVVVGILVILAIMAVVMYLYQNNPATVIKKTLLNISNATSFGFSVSMQASVNKEIINQDPFFGFLADNPIILESKGLVEHRYDGLSVSLENSIYLNEDTSTSFWDISAINIPQKPLHFRINSIATSTNPGFVDELMGQWVVMDSASTLITDSIIPRSFISALDRYNKIDSKKLTEFMKMTSDNTLITSINELPDESVNGIKLRHYQLSFNQDKIGKLINSFYSISNESNGWFSGAFINPWEVWIIKDTNNLYRVRMEFDGGKSIIIPTTLDGYFSGFNENYSISIPSQSGSLERIYEITNEESQP